MLLLLEEEQYKSLPEDRRVLYVLQWLQSLPQAIRTAEKVRLSSKVDGSLAWPDSTWMSMVWSDVRGTELINIKGLLINIKGFYEPNLKALL